MCLSLHCHPQNDSCNDSFSMAPSFNFHLSFFRARVVHVGTAEQEDLAMVEERGEGAQAVQVGRLQAQEQRQEGQE